MKTILKALLVIMLIIVVSAYFLFKPDIPFDYLKKQYTNNVSEFIEVDGMNVHFRKQGNGERSLLLLHGTGSSLHTWEGWAAVMRDSFTIYSVDLPAFGLTGPHPDRDYSMDAYVKFIKDFTLKMNLQRFSIAGNSLGGGIAWNFAIMYPENVDKLILISATGYPSDQTAGIFELARNPILGPLMKFITPRSLIRKNLKEVYAEDTKVTEGLVDRYYQLARREGNRQAFIDRAHTYNENRSHLVSSINVPTLIMWGEKDEWNGIVDAYKFQEDILNDTLIIYEDLGHIPMEEDPITTARDALKFLMDNHKNIGS